MSKKNESFEHWIDQSLAELPEWSEPEQFDLNNLGDKRQMYSRIVMSRAKVFRKVALIADDVFELEHPDKKNDPVAKEKFTQPILDEGDYYGVWHYFPWSNSLVQYPDAETHRQLLTSRNRELITADELKKLSTATVAHVGLSVGAHILEQTSHMGLGSKVILADPDIMSVPNLNRIHAGMPEVGMRKTDVAGIRLSELNPYVKQVHLREGITPYNVHVFEQYPPDLFFEEVDHLPTKILMRKAAEKARAPLIMATDTGDRTMIDVERYDIGGVEPFLGALTREELAQIEKQSPTPKQTVEIITKLIGMENISVRLAKSLGQIGISLGGIAQLGTTASVGGAYAAVAGREILLGRGPATGRYKVTPQQVLQTPYI
jgi:tRNA A37 threonylcarbamoyladenosine dehydratase